MTCHREKVSKYDGIMKVVKQASKGLLKGALSCTSIPLISLFLHIHPILAAYPSQNETKKEKKKEYKTNKNSCHESCSVS